jgi:hypothetical protein
LAQADFSKIHEKAAGRIQRLFCDHFGNEKL